ncbi:MAG: hypothetical protein HYR85_24405 [Planctomycetes bacterium]|nr:hypothetical protein [Planctomycetota bacterium]
MGERDPKRTSESARMIALFLLLVVIVVILGTGALRADHSVDMGWAIFGVAGVILVGCILLLGAGALGIDRGVLEGMSRRDYARGVLTYLFAMVTIGTIIVLVLFALVSKGGTDADANKLQFDRGKEVLSLLLGVFGAVVGFYFASDGSAPPKDKSDPVRVSQLDISPRRPITGQRVTCRAVVYGGTKPYRFGLGLGSELVVPNERVGDGGWIVKEKAVREFGDKEPHVVQLVVEDAKGERTTLEELIELEGGVNG